MYLRTVKVRSSSGTLSQYVRVVEADRQNGKVKQRTIADLGRTDLLVESLPKLQQLLGGDAAAQTGETPDPVILDAAPPGGRSSPSAPCSINWGSGPSSTPTWAGPKASRSPTGPSSSSPID